MNPGSESRYKMTTDESKTFYPYLHDWYSNLPKVEKGSVFGLPHKTALLCVDVTNGFCKEGALASPRVAKIIPPIVKLLKQAWEAGCHNIIFIQDTHEWNAVEFDAFPPHCTRASIEAQTVSEISDLPFYNEMLLIEKNSIDSSIDTELDDWMSDHPRVQTFVVVGDCTDLCTYQLAMHLKVSANAYQKTRWVVVPANCTETYDTSIDAAKETSAFAHPADFFHYTFLYHMAMNGIEVVKEIL